MNRSSKFSVIRFAIYVLILLFVSCEKVVEFDIDNTERYVVVNALPCTDSLLFVNVTYSRFFLDNQDFQPVTDATVSINYNGTTLISTRRDGANYGFPYQVTAGDTLTLSVTVPGYATITAGTRAVPRPSMTTPVAAIDTLMPISMGDITFTLTDNADRSDWYYVYVLERDSGSQWNLWEEKWDKVAVSSKLQAIDPCGMDPASFPDLREFSKRNSQ